MGAGSAGVSRMASRNPWSCVTGSPPPRSLPVVAPPPVRRGGQPEPRPPDPYRRLGPVDPGGHLGIRGGAQQGQLLPRPGPSPWPLGLWSQSQFQGRPTPPFHLIGRQSLAPKGGADLLVQLLAQPGRAL